MAPGCRASLPPLREIAGQFFDAGGVTCRRCGKDVNLWDSARTLMKLDFPLTLTAAGASQTFFVFHLSVGEVKEINLADFGVPENATVLAIGYTPQGVGCFPIEMHANFPIWRRTAPQMPEGIRGGLNRLRGLRNNLIHEGRIDDPIKPQDVTLPLIAEPLCASVFSFEYVRHIKSKLLLVSGG
jgi:hypothetical protein